jgi:hypothetical protein
MDTIFVYGGLREDLQKFRGPDWLTTDAIYTMFYICPFALDEPLRGTKRIEPRPILRVDHPLDMFRRLPISQYSRHRHIHLQDAS